MEDFRCLGAQETRFFAEFGAQALRAESVSFEVSWVTLGSPRSVPELSWALLGCSWLLLSAPVCSSPLPAPSPKHTQGDDTQHGQLPQTLALSSEFSRQPGVHHWTRLNEISSRQVSKLDSNDWISSYVPFTTDLLPIVAGPFLAQSSPGSVLLRVVCYATQLLHKSLGSFFRVSEPI